MQTSYRLKEYLAKLEHLSKETQDIIVYGTVTKISNFMIEAVGLVAAVGSICKIHLENKNKTILAEVIGFAHDITYLMAYEETIGVLPGNKISFFQKFLHVPVDQSLLGRIVNGIGEPIDHQGKLEASQYYPLYTPTINPIQRTRITHPLDVGVRAINALMSVGQGQRMGIFAGSGVGKSMLLGMITCFTQADVVIVGLIGERGREVKEFIEENIGPDNLKKTVIIAAPVDTSPLMRANGALVATTFAEYYRDQGLNVLLIIDSLTRYAQALRQIYLTLGELPSSKGFSPSVFAKISQLVERTGNGTAQQGSITSFYTILVEGDDMNDPIADHVRSVLDGHIVLSRQLADAGHYPAIDISASVSRTMISIVDEAHMANVHRFKKLYHAYRQNQDLIKMGMYQPGSDPVVDESMRYHEKMIDFLKQAIHEPSNFATDTARLMDLFE
ncbi:FliI/YscN family ATPase [Legionella nagasakiensis]|uniref:FliI/YscN family ATPase n=1 Tax=Legionella nagasakiensis TaxID=535290 RepID=UPI001056CE5C|nr:FliI/YscN family ATPase [Legionella nagasakiensis]